MTQNFVKHIFFCSNKNFVFFQKIVNFLFLDYFSQEKIEEKKGRKKGVKRIFCFLEKKKKILW